MTIVANLLVDSLPVFLDDRTADVGGAFYYDPLRVYSQIPLTWAWQGMVQQHPACLIDVGASTGCFSLLAKHYPEMTAYAFEPVPLTYDVLRSNVAMNELENRVKCYPMGVSNYIGKGCMHVVYPVGGSGVSMLDGRPRNSKTWNDIEIPVTTIDSFCRRYKIVPTMIKVDTEGGEFNVLKGARRTIEQYHPHLIIEASEMNALQYGYKVWELVRMIGNWGYTFHKPEEDLLCAYIGDNP